jgi:hypothetical protein
MTAVLMRKRLAMLEPIDDDGRRLLKRMAPGRVVSVEIKRPRNVLFHRKFFAMLNLILQNQEYYKSVDDLLDVCKLRIGHVKVVQTKRGEERIPKSISFAEMDETAFADFYDRAVDWVVTEVIPGLKKDDLERELMEFAA